MSNPWDLYECHPAFGAASAALDKAWDEAVRLAPELPAAERAKLAERHVYDVMKMYAKAGAMDSEPCSVLRWKVEKHFGTAGGWI